MMKGYLDTGTATTSTVTIASLPAGAWDIYVYVDGDNGGARTASYQISGAGIPTTAVARPTPPTPLSAGPSLRRSTAPGTT